MRTRLLLVVLVGLSSLALFGCPSLSTLQTPRTVPKGRVRQAVGLEFVGVSVEGGGSAVAPQVEYGVRIGVSDNIDIGFKAYFLGLEGGAKFQLVRGGFDLSIAPAASYTNFSVDDESFSFLYLHLPVLMGVQLGDIGQMGFGPKFMYALAFGTIDSGAEFASADGLLGGVFWNVLFQIGDVMMIGPEINAYVPLTGEGSDAFGGVIYQGGLVMAFGGLEEEEPVAVYQPYPQPQPQVQQPAPQPVQPMQPVQPVPPPPAQPVQPAPVQ